MKNFDRDKIIAIIEQDANLMDCYFGLNEGEACVIGGLLNAAGIPPELKSEMLEYYNGTPINAGGDTLGKAEGLLIETYGLTGIELRKLQKINDHEVDTEARRKLLIKAVNEFAENRNKQTK